MGCSSETEPVKFDEFWDYSNPSQTREQFLTLVDDGDEAYTLELKTQIARTYGLERNFKEAHAVLDSVEPYMSSFPIVVIRYHLERGRVFNSADDKEPAKVQFLLAFDRAQKEHEDFYAVDAAHMMAIAEVDKDVRTDWNLRAIEISERSKDQRARGWLGALANNMGWDRFDAGDYKGALEFFEKSRASYEEQERAPNERIARWSKAKAWRKLGRLDEALEEQLKQKTEYEALGEIDGYVFEELGEIYLELGSEQEAKEHFALAYAELSKDSWLMENESDRMSRMKQLAGD